MSKTSPKRPRFQGLKRLVQSFLFLGAAAAGVLAALYHHHVVSHPGEHLDHTHVRDIIAQESPVYYRDGITRVGVFFEDEHRTYVGFEDLPPAYVASIVAAEDSRFWSHPGFDVVHIASAMVDNLTAGKVVRGGSTLSQQTAKNLYYRPDRSLRSKLIEGLNALRLEHHFDKTEILTFYVNQFHVSGNGRGLGIAARHFFDKDVTELTVLESAFLAGLVKAPSHYDPFIGDADRRAHALTRATDRTRYVLRRLTEVEAEALAGPLPDRWSPTPEQTTAYLARVEKVRAVQAEAERLLQGDIVMPFKRGVFRFDSSAVLDEVARRLSEPPFDEVLASAGIDDPATAGLQVITTLDVEAQRSATYGLWHHLTEVGVMLEGLGSDAFIRTDGRGPVFDPDRPILVHEFRTATVTQELDFNGRRGLEIDLGGHTCKVDRDAIIRASVVVRRGEAGTPSAKIPTDKVNAFVDAMTPGSVVWASIRETREDGPYCDLEVRPELQGAAVVLEEGQVRAMVGGNDNRNFNRAIAPRQFGSTWKPIVYHAAMELGWAPSDLLDNRAAVFPFTTTYYYPRADHVSTSEVSLAWAGVNSENIASVWLLYHLLDHLPDARVAELAVELGLTRGAEEPFDAFRDRLQGMGVLPSSSRIPEALFLQSRSEVLAAISRSRHPTDEVALRSLLYGWGFDRERSRTRDRRRLAALDHSWKHLSALREQCGVRYGELIEALRKGETLAEGEPVIRIRRMGERIDVACGTTPEGFEAPTMDALSEEEATEEAQDGDDGDAPRGLLRGLRPKHRMLKQLSDEADMLVGGRLHASTLDDVSSAVVRRELQREMAGDKAPGVYTQEMLLWHQDFRTLLAMRFVKRMAEQYGVSTSIDDVLSMPLGAAEITLEEATKVYEGMITGKVWEFPGVSISRSGPHEVGIPAATTLLIAEIRDVDGHVVYQAAPVAKAGSAKEVPPMTADILRNVVHYGTGRRARGVVSIAGKDVPLGGKTGTTNDFRNAAFLGFAPRLAEAGPLESQSWLVGVYVGYDDNRSMSRRSIRLDGSRGALPAWIEVVRGLAAHGRLGVPESTPRSGWTSPVPDGLRRVSVEPDLGGFVMEGPALQGKPSVLTRPPEEQLAARAPVVSLEPVKRPVRIAPRLTDPKIVPAMPEAIDERPSIWKKPFGRRR